MTETITFDDFLKVDIRAGRVIDAQDFPEARKPAFKLWIDFGEEIGIKKTSAQITELYTLDDLKGRRIVAVAGGAGKVAAIEAALRSGILTGLIIDEATARALVERTDDAAKTAAA